jgi:hypothetical protein
MGERSDTRMARSVRLTSGLLVNLTIIASFSRGGRS